MLKMTQWYLNAVVVVLLVTAAAKLYSATGTAIVLDVPEAPLPLSYRQTLVLVGLLEVAVAGVILFCRGNTVKLVSVAWLGSNFVLYRVASALLTVGRPCPCLGSMTEKLPLKPATIDQILSFVVAYLVLGSTLFLIAEAWNNRRIRGKESLSLTSNLQLGGPPSGG